MPVGWTFTEAATCAAAFAVAASATPVMWMVWTRTVFRLTMKSLMQVDGCQPAAGRFQIVADRRQVAVVQVTIVAPQAFVEPALWQLLTKDADGRFLDPPTRVKPRLARRRRKLHGERVEYPFREKSRVIERAAIGDRVIHWRHALRRVEQRGPGRERCEPACGVVGDAPSAIRDDAAVPLVAGNQPCQQPRRVEHVVIHCDDQNVVVPPIPQNMEQLPVRASVWHPMNVPRCLQPELLDGRCRDSLHAVVVKIGLARYVKVNLVRQPGLGVHRGQNFVNLADPPRCCCKRDQDFHRYCSIMALTAGTNRRIRVSIVLLHELETVSQFDNFLGLPDAPPHRFNLSCQSSADLVR